MSQSGHEYEYKISLLVITACAYLACVAIANAIGSVCGVYDFVDVGMYMVVVLSLWALVTGPVGFILARHTFRMIVHRLTRCRRIRLGERDIVVPPNPWSLEGISVPYEKITKISCVILMGWRTICVKYAGGKFTISDASLPTRADAEEILGILCEKTSLRFALPIRWPRQFSLASILVVMTGLALFFGVLRWLFPDWGLQELCFMIGVLAIQWTVLGFVCWLLLSRRRWGRVFAVGFVLGVILEHVTVLYCHSHNLMQRAPGTGAPKGWYPLGVPIERILVLLSGPTWQSWPILWAWSISYLASGVICGVFAVVVWCLGRYAVRRLRSGH